MRSGSEFQSVTYCEYLTRMYFDQVFAENYNVHMGAARTPQRAAPGVSKFPASS